MFRPRGPKSPAVRREMPFSLAVNRLLGDHGVRFVSNLGVDGFCVSVRGVRLGRGSVMLPVASPIVRGLVKMPVRDRTMPRFELKRSRASAQSCGCTGCGCVGYP